ncbi:hypothetical protein OOT46_26045 [Aquabacterium sp. A7-Y]|uniref:hypothetical protein n=1 Tax=Aquabacterium sp. A7-Y TaxID=1349605 RepID=UPI00223DC276|nr:hypothetical protein [Aquabacterium sp. A7-Y]MCW7541277.1 hypothetical protein [Aquabacterium sp. A7-Y]
MLTLNPFAPFIPVASRDLIFVGPDQYEMSVHVAIGAPYTPAQAEDMKGYAGCLVLTCDDPTLATEIHGADEMEALMAGLDFIESFLKRLAVEGKGRLKTLDGLPFDPNGSALLQQQRELTRRGPSA